MDDIAQRNLTNPLDLFHAMFNASRDLAQETKQATTTTSPTHMHHDMMSHGSMDHSAQGTMDHTGGGHGSHSMATYFYVGYDDVQMVLKNWIVDDLASLLGTCLLLVAIVLVAEWLRLWRENFQFAMIQKLQSRSSSVASNRDQETDAMFNTMSKYKTESTTRPIAQSWRAGLTNRDHIILALTYTLQQTISLVLMLVFMTFNLYLCAAVVFGHGLGYYLFAWRRIIPVAGLAMTELGMCH